MPPDLASDHHHITCKICCAGFFLSFSANIALLFGIASSWRKLNEPRLDIDRVSLMGNTPDILDMHIKMRLQGGRAHGSGILQHLSADVNLLVNVTSGEPQELNLGTVNLEKHLPWEIRDDSPTTIIFDMNFTRNYSKSDAWIKLHDDCWTTHKTKVRMNFAKTNLNDQTEIEPLIRSLYISCNSFDSSLMGRTTLPAKDGASTIPNMTVLTVAHKGDVMRNVRSKPHAQNSADTIQRWTVVHDGAAKLGG